MKTRRQFVRSTVLATMASAVVPGVLGEMAQSSNPLKTAPGLDCSTFTTLQGTSFDLSLEKATIRRLSLLQVVPAPKQPHVEGFSLLFTESNLALLPQSTYTFFHPQLGDFEMFVVPKPGDGKSCYYEAVFNRLV